MVKRRKHPPLKNKSLHEGQDQSRHRSLKERIFTQQSLWFFALLFFAFSLNAIEMDWGLSGYVTWQPDAIEGEISVNHLPLLFKQWRHKYPRGQYLINWVFYKPLIQAWTKKPVLQRTPSGKTVQTVLTPDRMRYLAGISRWIVAAMGLGTIIAVFVLTKYLFGDYLAGWFAALALSTSCLFLFHSSIGHVDVPFTFWFAWSCVFCAYAAIEHKWRYYILMALCGGYAFCTKEGYFGYLPGLAVVYCVLRAADQYKKTKNMKTALLSVFSLKVIAAAAVFLLLFIIMNGCFNFIKEFTGRMEYWKNDPIFHDKRPHLLLLQKTGKHLYASLGWPLLATIVAGIIYFTFRYPAALAMVLIPLVVFYLLTVTRIHYTAERFFLPAYVCFAVAVGKTAADWIRFQKVPRAIRYAIVAVIGGLTILYCVGLKLEMRNDTRNRVEAWFGEHVDKNVLIGSGMKRWYAPRLKYQGYQLIDGWHSEGVQTSNGLIKVFPEYLIMSNMFPCSANYKDDSVFKKNLYQGQAGYKEAARFKALYFPPSGSVFSIAGRPYKPVEWISPTVNIFQKETGSASLIENHKEHP